MTKELENKIEEAKQALCLAADLSRTYYNAPLIICYSGGKDSDVMLDIAKRCLKPEQFEVLNSHTTVDAPETVYHIRDVFKALDADGIHTEIRMPRYKGEPTSMWKLIVDKRTPPTRLMRYCCQVLKEAATPNRIVAVGVREDESTGRKGRDVFAVLAQRKSDAEFRSLQHTYAMFKLDQLGREDAHQCVFIQSCKQKNDTICNPIYKFTEADVWSYAKIFGVKMNPLYAEGFKRIGCIGCPFGGARTQNVEFKRWPKYKANYIKAFERMLKERNKRNMVNMGWNSGEDVFRWWIGENPKQVRIDDILNQQEVDNNGR